jgi:hypothetical protein
MTSAFALAALMGTVALADTHHDGGSKVKGVQNGQVHLHTTKHGHASHANLRNGKVTGISVHKAGKDVTNQLTTKKFKTKNKKHLTEAGAYVDENTDLNAFVFIGFGYYCPFDNQWVIFWFAVEIVDGGDDGAEEI